MSRIRGSWPSPAVKPNVQVFSLNSKAMYNTAPCAIQSLVRVADVVKLLAKCG